MPAIPFNALAAIVVASTGVPLDAQIGLRNGLPGLLLNSMEFNGGRDEKEKTDHLGTNALDILANPKYSLVVDAEITQEAGTFSNRHPGEAIDRSLVLEFRTGTQAKFPDTGYFRFKEPKQGARPADLNTMKFELKLMSTWQQTVHVVTGP